MKEESQETSHLLQNFQLQLPSQNPTPSSIDKHLALSLSPTAVSLKTLQGIAPENRDSTNKLWENHPTTMRFHFATNFTNTALRRRFSAPYIQQCRPYAPFRHRHPLTKKASVSETHSHISTHFSTFRRFCSSKPSNSSMGFLSWYLRMLESRPILTKSLSAAVIYAAADITSQAIHLFYFCSLCWWNCCVLVLAVACLFHLAWLHSVWLFSDVFGPFLVYHCNLDSAANFQAQFSFAWRIFE